MVFQMKLIVPAALIVFTAASSALAAEASVAALEQVKAAYGDLSRKQNDQALRTAKKALAALEANPAKPSTLTEADWTKRKALAIGTAHWIAGVAEASKTDIFAADKDLRAALPAVKGDAPMYSSTLFYLGVVNYQIGRQTFNKQKILEGAKFSEQCAQMPGQYQVEAYNNAKAMRKDAAGMP